MMTHEKDLAVGRIAARALGQMMRDIVKAQKGRGKESWTASQILENIVMDILRQSQVDIREEMEK